MEAKDYVDRIMSSSQPVANVRTPVSSRKRHSSDSDEVSFSKKSKSAVNVPATDENHTHSVDVMAQARRALYGQTPSKSDDVMNVTENRLDLILNKIDSLATELKSVNKNVTDRIDRLESELEKKLADRLSDKFSQMLDKRLNNEMKRVNKSVDERIDTLRADINNDLESINSKVDSISDAIQTVQPVENRKSLNAVFRKLPETVNEKLEDKVNMVIKDHMKIDVKVVAAQRIQNNNADSMVPGVVIATFRSEDERNQVLKAKVKLQKTAYNDVFVHADQTKEERLASSNLRTMVNAVNRGGQLSIRGNRVVSGNRNSDIAHNNRNNSVNSQYNDRNKSGNLQYNGNSGANSGGARLNNSNDNSQGNNLSGRNFRGRGHSQRGQGHRGQSQGYRGQGQRQNGWRGRGGQR